jgi:hypothetical protein
MKLEGKYSIELFKPGGEGAGLEKFQTATTISRLLEPFTGAALLNCRAGWSCCATGRGFWPAVIAPKTMPCQSVAVSAMERRLRNAALEPMPFKPVPPMQRPVHAEVKETSLGDHPMCLMSHGRAV